MPIPNLTHLSGYQLLAGLILAVLIAWAARRAGALSDSGAVAAIFTGILIFGLGGMAWAAPLLTFFISSSALSRAFGGRKAGLSEKFSKGHRRDWGQVLANGGLAALLAAAAGLYPQYNRLLWFAFAGAMAAANADTWATELGVLNSTAPRLITTMKPAERGASGAVSALGSLAALGGAALVGAVAALLTRWALPQISANMVATVFLAAALGGTAGSFFDSLLGATVQAIYWCSQCCKETERYPLHTCGTPTEPLRGWGWVNNDVVNFLATAMGAVVALGFGVFLG
jgi:uncharacterized protein (TIGR00297 family)